MNTPRIAGLDVPAPLTLAIHWRDGTRTTHDVSARILGEPWGEPLRNPAVFNAAQTEDAGLWIAWPGTDIAFSAQGLWDDAHPRDPTAKWMTPEEFVAWMKEMDFSFVRAAEALDASPRMLKYYAAGTHAVPKTVWLACMHLASAQARRSHLEKRPAPAA
jgi:hypothetical protein